MKNFSSNQIEQIAKFFYRIANPIKNFRQEVLQAFNEIFGYKRVTFWLADEEKVLITPEYMNVDSRIMYAYEDGYYKYDPFNIINLSKNQQKKTVILVDDLLDMNQYLDENIYFNDVLKSYDYVNKMVINLVAQGEYLGGMSFLRKKAERSFTDIDRELVNILGKYISKLLLHQNAIAALNNQKNSYQDFAGCSMDGLVIMNEQGKISFMNDSGKRILAELQEKKIIHRAEDIIHKIFVGNKLFATMESTNMLEIEGFTLYIKARIHQGKVEYTLIFVQKLMPEKIQEERAPALVYTDSLHKEEPTLTNREREIVGWVVRGYSNQQIAQELFISLQTVKTHLYHIYQKYGVNNRSSFIYKLQNSKNKKPI